MQERKSNELMRCHRDRVLFTRDLTLDVSVRNRNGRFIFSKYCAMAGTRHTARSNPIYVQANAASRHAVSICQSTWFYCPPQWLLTKSYLSFSILFLSFSLSLSFLQPPIFCYLYTKPSRVVAVRQRQWWRQCRQQKISNKSFRNPASLLSASPDFHYSLLCHLRTLPKLFPFLLASPYRPIKRETYSIVFIFLSLLSPFLDSHYPIFSIFSPFYALVFRCILANPRTRSFPLFFFLHFYTVPIV